VAIVLIAAITLARNNKQKARRSDQLVGGIEGRGVFPSHFILKETKCYFLKVSVRFFSFLKYLSGTPSDKTQIFFT